MDIQTICLGILSLGKASGYEIKKRFEESFSHFYSAGFGSIYPALARLSEDGLVTFEEVAQEGKPDKKVYALTDTGAAQFKCELAAAEPEHRVKSEFLVQLFFADLLPRTRLKEILDQRLQGFSQYVGMLEQARELPAPNLGHRLTAAYGEAVLGAALRFLQEDAPRIIAAFDEQERSTDHARESTDA